MNTKFKIHETFSYRQEALNEVYNVAFGDQITLNEITHYLQEISGKEIQPAHSPTRPGDVPHSKADISKIEKKLGYEPKVYFQEGLGNTYRWYKEKLGEKWDLGCVRP